MKRKAIKKSIGKAIIKRRGHLEKYEERKVYASCFFACKNAHLHDKKCEEIASKVAKAITSFVKKRSVKGVTSTQIFKAITKEMRKYDQDAAFLYATHRDIS